MSEHKHNCAANTNECFQTFIGCQVKGFLSNALPLSRADLARGTKTLVFECGWGLTFASNGSFWVESVEDIKRAVSRVKDELRRTQRDIKGVLALAGEASDR